MSYRHAQHGRVDQVKIKALRRALGQKLKARRDELEMTQMNLAEAAGLAYYTMISQIESGAVRLPPDRIEAYAKALRMPVEQLATLCVQHYDPVTFALMQNSKRRTRTVDEEIEALLENEDEPKNAPDMR